MKFHWGHGITLVIVAFMGYILALVSGALSTNQDLEYTDYYEREIDYQSTIDALERGATAVIDVTQEGKGVVLSVPEAAKATAVVELFRPGNSALDFEVELSGHRDKTVPTNLFVPGLYRYTVRWQEPSGSCMQHGKIMIAPEA